MDFEKRLEQAIQRGEKAKSSEQQHADQQRLTEEELKHLHSTLRLELSEHIEDCLKKLADHFPGFRYQTIVGEKGWGAGISRDDVNLGPSRSRQTLYSRLEMVIRPFSPTHIVELNAKGTIHNKETITRDHYQMLEQADPDSFKELIDLWVLEFAEQYAHAQ